MDKSSKIHLLFETGVIFKTIFAILEIASGVILYFATEHFALKILLPITQNEHILNHYDFISDYLINWTHHFFGATKNFASFYLLSHGLVKIVALIGLLKKQYWAYPVSIIIFSLFIVYQLIRFSYTHSIWLIFLTVVDVFVIWLIWQESKAVKLKAAVSKDVPL